MKSAPETLAKIKDLNLKVEQNNPQQAFITAPDDVRGELPEDAMQSEPIKMHRIHMRGERVSTYQPEYSYRQLPAMACMPNAGDDTWDFLIKPRRTLNQVNARRSHALLAGQ